MMPIYEDQIVLFLDFLGFGEASVQLDERRQFDVLGLLQQIAQLRSEFELQSEHREDGSSRHSVKPTVSTFSDHIVISYPTERVNAGLDSSSDFFILHQISLYVALIAAQALKIGFLIRGGVARGKLYHSGGVVFGEALVRAYQIESKIAVYPRVVVSDEIVGRLEAKFRPWVKRDFDGLSGVDYFRDLVLRAVPPGNNYPEHTKAWYEALVEQTKANVASLNGGDMLAARAKWLWFARKLRESLKEANPKGLQDLGLSLEKLDWVTDGDVKPA